MHKERNTQPRRGRLTATLAGVLAAGVVLATAPAAMAHDLTPTLTCVDVAANGTVTAHFGYTNIGNQTLNVTPSGKVLLRLRRPWRDGTRAILFEPTELLEKISAIIPRPKVNLLLYHGVLAPHARRRRAAVAAACCGRLTPDRSETSQGDSSRSGEDVALPSSAVPPKPAVGPAEPGDKPTIAGSGSGSGRVRLGSRDEGT